MAMNLNEEATLTLKGNTRDLDNELKLLDTRAKELKKTLKEIETSGTGKGSEEWKKYRAELTQVNAELAKTRKEVDLNKLTYGQLDTLVKQLGRDLKGLVPGTEDFIKATNRLNEAKAKFQEVDKQVKSIQQESEQLAAPTKWQKIASGVGTVSKAFGAFFALQIVGYIIDIGKAIFETTGKFERYEKVLTTALGSEKLAKQSMAAIKEMAKNTVFTVDELTEGYVKLVNRGMRPSQKEMVAMTDLAASQGKKFDELVEAALDAQTGEFERLKEFGIRASKSGDQVTLSFKGMNQVVKNTPEAIQGALTKFGEMNGVARQNAKMMETLEGQLSNAGDAFDALKVAVGDRLRPVFVAILSVFGTGVQWLGKIVAASDPVVAVFGDWLDAVGALYKSLLPIIQRIFPQLTSGSLSLSSVMQGVGLVFRALLLPIQVAVAALIGIGQTIGGVVQAGKALVLVLKGDFAGAAAEYGKAKATFEQVGATATKSFTAIGNQWKKAMVDVPKQTAQEAVFAAKDTENRRQEGMTEEQKKAADKRAKEADKARKKEEADHQKHLEDVQKANAKALEDLAKLEAEAHIASIKDEETREKVKLMAKRDLEAEEIMRGIQDEKIKNAQIAQLDKKLQEDVERVHTEFAEKKRKKEEEVAQKRLEVEKTILTQQQQAENALFDWRELMAKNNATKLAQVHRERADKQYEITLERLRAEEAAEVAKANREITDKEQLDRAVTAIEGRYHNERLLAEKKHADEVDKINKELSEKKKAAWTNAGNAFSALLKGDLNSFVEYADKIVQGEKSAWQKRLAENMAKYEAVAQMAQAAVQFLNKLEQQKAERAIAAAKKERDEKVALLSEQMATEKAAQDAAEAEKQRVTQESNDKIQTIKSASEASISSLEQQYRQLSSSEEKRKLNEQLAGYKENAQSKKEAAKQAANEAIEAAQMEAKQSIDASERAEKAAIKSAQNEKEGRIDAAEAARDAEIEAIKKRADVDSQTRKKLLDEAQDKFEKEKKLAEDEAKLKIDQAKDTAKAQSDLAKETAKTKIELAKDAQEAELKAIEAVQDGNEEAAKAILTKAKEDAQEKIRLAKEEAEKKIEEAEREKREKLKKVEQEKQQRIQNQKELNRSIEAENAKAKQIEAAAKQKAWQAQQKADIASALIAGALATLKALASGFFPLNLVFAATTAVMTGIQVAMIKRQPAPQFRHGGFVAQGPPHGSQYGKGGIALVRRDSGQEVGEMEGDEAIVSKEQTRANWPLISRMFQNARTPSRRSLPVMPIYRNALGKRAFQTGGLLEPLQGGEMYLFGSKAKKAAKKAEEEAAAAAAEASQASFDTAGGEGDVEGMADAKAAGEAAKKQGEEQLKLLAEIREAVKQSDPTNAIATMEMNLSRAIENGFMTERQALGTLGVNLTLALEQVEQTTQVSLANVAKTTVDTADRLVRELGQAMQRSDVQQTDGSERVVRAIDASADRLSSQLIQAIDAGAVRTSTAVSEAELATTRAVSGLTLELVEGVDRLTQAGRSDVEWLGDRLERVGQTGTDQVEAAIGKAGTAQIRALDALGIDLTRSINEQTKTTVDAFDALGKRTTENLADLETSTVRALDELGKRTTKNLADLDQSTTKALSNLDDDLTRVLTDLDQSLTKTLGTVKDDLTETLVDVGRDLAKTVTESGTDVIDAVKNLNQDTDDALTKLGDEVTKALSDLSDDLTDSLTDLKKGLMESLDTLGTDTTRSLADVDDHVTKALSDLSADTTTALDALRDEVTNTLDELNRDTGKSLADLSENTTKALDTLNQDTGQALTTLGDKTERALELSATRTTQSVDGLSIEVRSLKGSINAVEGAVYAVRGAVNSVEGAVWSTNQAGRLDALIASISTFGGGK